MLTMVTGATGFTGGHLARELKRRGHAVRALVRDRGRAAALQADGIELFEGDVRDAASVARASEGCDNCAARCQAKRCCCWPGMCWCCSECRKRCSRRRPGCTRGEQKHVG